jgi:O-antigen/teichoic acid export membrane protein
VGYSSLNLKHAWVNSAATILVKGPIAALRIGFLLWAAKLNGPDVFGRLALCFAIVEILRMVVDFGTESLYLRNLARSQTRHDQMVQLAKFGVFRIPAALIGVVLYYGAVALVLPGRITPTDLMPGVLILSSAGIGYALTYYQSQLRMRRAAMLLMPIVFLGVVSFALILPSQVAHQLGLLIMFEAAAATIFLADMAREGLFRLPTVQIVPYLRTGRSVALESLPLAAVGMIATAYTRLDVLAIAPLAGSVALGLYSYAYRVSEPFRFLASAIDATLYSYLSAHIDRTSGAALIRLFLVVVSYATGFSIAAAVSGWLLMHIGYEEYRGALFTVGVLSIALFLRCVNGYFVSLLYAKGRYTTVLKIAACNALFMSAIIFPFVSRFGIVGAAWALVGVEGLNLVLQSRAAFRPRNPNGQASL